VNPDAVPWIDVPVYRPPERRRISPIAVGVVLGLLIVVVLALLLL
jgi:hypothetical protein